jgi:iron(III) transport system permease protein
MLALALLCAVLVSVPLLALLIGVLYGLVTGVGSDGAAGSAWATLAHQASTVLPGYALTTLALCALVCIGVVLLGFGSALLVVLFEFPGRRVVEWALVLPMAAPAYVLAYAYTDFFQPSGSLMGIWQGVDIRNLWGAAFVLSAALYPYVYLLARAGLLAAGANVWEAARSLGANRVERVRRVLWPMARPSVAAGAALAMMETLADYGVTSYFGVNTLTTGIYKAWLGMNDWMAATQLAVGLLAFVVLALWAEKASRARIRTARGAQDRPLLPERLRGATALAVVVLVWLPVVAGFVLPSLMLLKLLLESDALAATNLARFAGWAWNTFKLAVTAASIAFAFAALLSVAARLNLGRAARSVRLAAQGVSLGYAVPGAVIAVGMLLPVMLLQQAGVANAGVWLTGSAIGIVYAYVVRFSAVALQPMQAGYAALSPRLDESARSLGAGRARIVLSVHAPLLKTSLLTAWLIVLIDVMKELPATALLRPFGYDTLAVMAHQFARDERLGEAALPALAIVGLGMLPVMLLVRSMRK